MRCRILHESAGRMRVHALQYRMTYKQADTLEYWLQSCDGINRVTVNDRTGNIIIYYSAERQKVIDLLSSFRYDEHADAAPEKTGRELSREFENRIITHVVKRGITRFLFPVDLRNAYNLLHSLKFIKEALMALKRGKLEVSVLDAVTITVSMLRNDFETAGNVMFLLGLSEIIDEWTHKKSLDDLARSMSLNIDKVWQVLPSGQDIQIPVSEIRENDLIRVGSGSVIPLDGFVYSGAAEVNQASLTGESLAVSKQADTPVYAGTVIENGELVIRVSKTSGSGRYDRIVRMIEDSQKLKSDSENRAARLADRLVPWSLGGTLITYLLTRNVQKALAVLMVDFSCALKLTIPIAVLSAMREASLYQVSVKGGKYLEVMAKADTVIYDKTGTLTYSEPRVADVVAFGNYDKDEMLRLAACLEEHFPHSIANAVVRDAAEKGLIHEEKHSRVEYVVAHGIVSHIDGKRVLIGSHHFIFEDEKCRILKRDQKKFDELPGRYSHLYLAINKTLAAVICIEDPVRAEAPDVIRGFRDLGIRKQVMMTGDSLRTARAIAELAGIEEFHAEVLPEDKANYVIREHEQGNTVIMIGDGINDTPALAEADVAVAISNGAAIAREVADMTVPEQNIMNLVRMRELGLALQQRINSNYRFIMGFNSSLILLGVFGILSPTITAYMHNLSTLALSIRAMTDLLDQ